MPLDPKMESKIKMHAVSSSNILATGYDKITKTLIIQFNNGKKYMYADIPEGLYNGIFTSRSAGHFVQQQIVKGGFEYTKI